MAGWREDRLFSKMHSGKMRGTRDKLEHRKLDTKMMGGQTLEHRSREAVGTPSLVLFKSQLDNLVQLILFE